MAETLGFASYKESKLSDVDTQIAVLLKAAEIAEISLKQEEQADEISFVFSN